MSSTIPGMRTDRREENERSPLRLRSVIRKSALLNAVIVLTSFPALALAGGPRAVVPALAVMVGISLVIWTFTFALYSFASLVQVFWPSASHRKPSVAPQSMDGRVIGVTDRWLDGPL